MFFHFPLFQGSSQFEGGRIWKHNCGWTCGLLLQCDHCLVPFLPRKFHSGERWIEKNLCILISQLHNSKWEEFRIQCTAAKMQLEQGRRRMFRNCSLLLNWVPAFSSSYDWISISATTFWLFTKSAGSFLEKNASDAHTFSTEMKCYPDIDPEARVVYSSSQWASENLFLAFFLQAKLDLLCKSCFIYRHLKACFHVKCHVKMGLKFKDFKCADMGVKCRQGIPSYITAFWLLDKTLECFEDVKAICRTHSQSLFGEISVIFLLICAFHCPIKVLHKSYFLDSTHNNF